MKRWSKLHVVHLRVKYSESGFTRFALDCQTIYRKKLPGENENKSFNFAINFIEYSVIYANKVKTFHGCDITNSRDVQLTKVAASLSDELARPSLQTENL